MKRRIHTAFAACVVVLALVFAEPEPAAASHEGSHHQNRRRTIIRARHKAKAKRKSRRRSISFICPMHPDIREKSRGTCPKCLMDLVAEPRDQKAGGG